jgi:hypothetical protein
MQSVYDELQLRRIPIELFTKKRVHRRQLPVTKSTLVVGYVDTVLSVLKMLEVEPPPTNDYPSALQPFLHRRIWESTVEQLTNQIFEGHVPVFAKPKDRKKRFTGHVFRHVGDLAYLEGASKQTPLFCSDVVAWVSEYRVFVIHGKIVGIQHYNGDAARMIDKTLVATAIQELEQSGETTAAYAVDFGLLATGQTAVVEWNDGFSLGSYGLDKAIYTDLLIERWCELTA